MQCKDSIVSLRAVAQNGGASTLAPTGIITRIGNALAGEDLSFCILPANKPSLILACKVTNFINCIKNPNLNEGETIQEIINILSQVERNTDRFPGTFLRIYLLRLLLEASLKNSFLRECLFKYYTREKQNFSDFDSAQIAAWLVKQSANAHHDDPIVDRRQELLVEYVDRVFANLSQVKRANMLGYLCGLIGSDHEPEYAWLVDRLSSDLPSKVRDDLLAYYAWKCFSDQPNTDEKVEYENWLAQRAVALNRSEIQRRWAVWSSQPAENANENATANILMEAYDASAFSGAMPLQINFSDYSRIYPISKLVDFALYSIDKDVQKRALDGLIKAINRNTEMPEQDHLALIPFYQSHLFLTVRDQIKNASGLSAKLIEMTRYRPEDTSIFVDISLWECAFFVGLSEELYPPHPQKTMPDIDKLALDPSSLWTIPYSLIWKNGMDYSAFYEQACVR